MKKLILLLFLLFAGINSYAQKGYVHILVSDLAGPSSSMNITGDVSSEITELCKSQSLTIGEVLCLFAENGYNLEFMTAPVRSCSYDGATANNKFSMCYVLSTTNTSNSSSYIQTVKYDDMEDVYEVARYNLQGLPVNEDTKGVQIIVYSNYTSKTVIVE